jgi:MFS family permease
MPAQPKLLLPIIIFSQFAGTSLWFAGNAIIDAIQKDAGSSHANITSVVQFGFIAGTLVFSLFTIADRFPSSKVFFFSALIASAANLLIIPFAHQHSILLLLRFITGFFLAGIYPVGMKIAADLFPEKLGKALGYLVGALVLGTSFPHFVRSQLQSIHWETVILSTSALAFIGGILILLFVPSKQKSAVTQKPDLFAAFKVFRSKPFRSAAFGYFGHMWELYAFWAILPVLFSFYNERNGHDLNIYFWSFIIIATGGIGCALGGLVSQKTGSKKVAFYSLLISGLCCSFSFLFFQTTPILFLLFMIAWGLTVIADSPQFSTLVARNAQEKNKGTALTIVTSIGFAITIVSIQLLKLSFEDYKEYGLLLLAPGPIIGLLAFYRLKEIPPPKQDEQVNG